jgi:hypothetical protein
MSCVAGVALQAAARSILLDAVIDLGQQADDCSGSALRQRLRNID